MIKSFRYCESNFIFDSNISGKRMLLMFKISDCEIKFKIFSSLRLYSSKGRVKIVSTAGHSIRSAPMGGWSK